jgi:hypothetical protein
VREAINRAIVAMLGAVAAAVFFAAHAEAQSFWFGGAGSPRWAKVHRAQPSLRARRTRRQSAEHAEPAAGPHGPLFGIIVLPEQRIYIYNSDGLVVSSKISTGMPGHRTPAGVFSIIGRERWHRSNIYSGAPMPYMQRITWSGVALHLGVVPGYPASHGCIRLPSGFAERLWGMTKIGERIVIAPQSIGPAAFEHPALPQPMLQPAPLPSAAVAAPLAATADASAVAARATSSDALPTGTSSPTLLTPLQYAQALKSQAAADAAAATAALKQASERVRACAEEVRKANAQLRALEAAHVEAEKRLAARRAAVAGARTPLAREAAETAATAATADLAQAEARHRDAVASGARAQQEADAAQRTLADARAALTAAQASTKEATRRLSPVSVLVSKRDQRVYIRQGLVPVLDAPASVREPAVPLGTHVFIASSLQEATLAWTVISLPPALAREEIRPRRGQATVRASKPEQASVLAPSTAAQALERIELPKEVSARIAQLVWIGASLIVSDEPLSDETSDNGTDIVVRTH